MKRISVLLILTCLILTLFVSCDDRYIPKPRIKPDFIEPSSFIISEALGQNFEITVSYPHWMYEGEEYIETTKEITMKRVGNDFLSYGQSSVSEVKTYYKDGILFSDYDFELDQFTRAETINLDFNNSEMIFMNTAIEELNRCFWDCYPYPVQEVTLINSEIFLERWMDVYELINTDEYDEYDEYHRVLYYVDRITKVVFKVEAFDKENNLIKDKGYEITKFVQGGVTIPKEETISLWLSEEQFESIDCPKMDPLDNHQHYGSYFSYDGEKNLIYFTCVYCIQDEKIFNDYCKDAFDAGYCKNVDGLDVESYEDILDDDGYYAYTEGAESRIGLFFYEEDEYLMMYIMFVKIISY